MHGIEKELGRPVYGLAENLFRSMPVVGTLWARSGGVAAHPDNAYRLLHDEDQLVLVFPEGTKGTGKHYRDRYQLRRFGRGGFVEIAMRAGVPVDPDRGRRAPKRRCRSCSRATALAKLLNIPYFPITANMLMFGPARARRATSRRSSASACCRPCTSTSRPNQERYSRSRVMEESERIRRMVQDALYDMLRTRRSVWFG